MQLLFSTVVKYSMAARAGELELLAIPEASHAVQHGYRLLATARIHIALSAANEWQASLRSMR